MRWFFISVITFPYNYIISQCVVLHRFLASILSRAEQQAIFLQDRQLAFKKAAVQAKTNGDMELAKKYLRMAKVSNCENMLYIFVIAWYHHVPSVMTIVRDISRFPEIK